MINLKVRIDDSQVRQFFKQSPKGAKWAMKEALSMYGGHGRKSLKAEIESGEYSDPKLHPAATTVYEGKNLPPLHALSQVVSFKYLMTKGVQVVRIGFLIKGASVWARKLMYSRRFRVTPQLRKLFARRGVPLRKTTKMLTIPDRPVLIKWWQGENKNAAAYIIKRFRVKFFDIKNPFLRK